MSLHLERPHQPHLSYLGEKRMQEQRIEERAKCNLCHQPFPRSELTSFFEDEPAPAPVISRLSFNREISRSEPLLYCPECSKIIMTFLLQEETEP